MVEFSENWPLWVSRSNWKKTGNVLSVSCGANSTDCEDCCHGTWSHAVC